MVRHIVLWKLKDAQASNAAGHAASLRSRFKALLGVVRAWNPLRSASITSPAITTCASLPILPISRRRRPIRRIRNI